MSLYNMVCGWNPAAGRLLHALNLSQKDIPRIRDVWVNKDLTEITVYTRTGGGNRPDYEEENKKLQSHPLYLRDHDDDFDSTFAMFVFTMTKEEALKLREEIAAAAPGEEEAVMEAITQSGPDKLKMFLGSGG